jgi:hypothetical protein
MNNLIKYNNLIILKNILKIDKNNFNLFYNNKVIKFINNESYFIYLTFINENRQNIKINCLLNNKKIITLKSKSDNNSFCIIHKILNIHKNDILTFKNINETILDITNFKINIIKL